MAERIRLPDNLAELLDVLDDSELAELARIALASNDPDASAVASGRCAGAKMPPSTHPIPRNCRCPFIVIETLSQRLHIEGLTLSLSRPRYAA